jgi:hypothetical protein
MPNDPSIRDWGNADPLFPQGWPPGWPWATSPDIYVDNNGNRMVAVAPNNPNFRYHLNVNETGEPEKGRSDNRLFAWVRNLGADPVSNVIVEFLYCPYGFVNGQNPYLHFKQIALVTISLGSATVPGADPAEKEVEVWWDLSDLSENNGGIWPAPISAFDHFCVRVNVYRAGDANPYNNLANNNFVNIVSSSAFSPIPLLVANSDAETKSFEIAPRNLPEGWALSVRGLGEKIQSIGMKKPAKFTLRPGEERFLTLTVIPREKASLENQGVDVAVLSEGKAIGGISMITNIGKRRRKVPSLNHVPAYTLVNAAPSLRTLGGKL